MSEVVFIYVTHPDAGAALALGRALVEAGLAACVNVLPGMRSVYRWEGRVEDGAEAVMIVKSVADRVPALQAGIKAAHPYACPCVAVLPVVGGDPAYLAWIAAACGDVVRPAGLEPAT